MFASENFSLELDICRFYCFFLAKQYIFSNKSLFHYDNNSLAYLFPLSGNYKETKGKSGKKYIVPTEGILDRNLRLLLPLSTGNDLCSQMPSTWSSVE